MNQAGFEKSQPPPNYSAEPTAPNPTDPMYQRLNQQPNLTEQYPPNQYPTQQPPYGQPAYGQPPYGQPPNGLPRYGQPAYSPQYAYGQNQHTTNVVQVGHAPPPAVYFANRPYINFTGAIVFSCIVYWLFGCLFGMVAFILAMIGQSQSTSGDERSARGLLIASYVLSTIGMILGIIALIIIIVVLTKNPYYKSTSCYYYYYGSSYTCV